MEALLYDEKPNVTVLPLSKFNVMQITRQRTKPIAKIDNCEKCPTCNGKGTLINPITSIVYFIEGEIRLSLKTTKFFNRKRRK